MDANYHTEKIGEAELQVDLQHGAKIMLLKLDGVTVIKASPLQGYLAAGSYLMYPWVNRLEKYDKAEFKDGKGLPLHGLYATRKRTLTRGETEASITLHLCCDQFDADYPKFTETWVLTSNTLTINFNSEATEKDVVCFGYHPYLQLNEVKLKPQNVSFETDIAEHLHLKPSLLPTHPFLAEPAHILPGQKLDDLFRNGSYFSIVSTQLKKKVTIRSPQLKYWQIYTPDQHRIAIQPMSFTANIFAIREQLGTAWVPPPSSASISLSVTGT